MRILLSALLLLVLGCATAQKMNRLSLGMTKEQVIGALGAPVSVSARDGAEFLNYRFSETGDDAVYGIERPYVVRLRAGKVDGYGRQGEFMVPTQKVIIDKAADDQ